jgi:uncharacterized protein YukE
MSGLCGGGGYKVELEALDKAAAAYRRQGNAIQWHLERIRSKAALPDQAFGNLPQSKGLAAAYQAFLDQFVSDMNKLSESLTTGGDRVCRCAANYRGAESENTIG